MLKIFPVRVHAWVAGQVPWHGAHKRQPHIDDIEIKNIVTIARGERGERGLQELL